MAMKRMAMRLSVLVVLERADTSCMKYIHDDSMKADSCATNAKIPISMNQY